MKVIVTGASGFVGGRLCIELCREGHEIIALSRRRPKFAENFSISWHSVDLSADFPQSVQKLFQSADAVFHVAAKVDMWGDFKEFFATNVLGTRRILELCQKMQVPSLIYTSSPSVIANGKDLCGVDESVPYPTHYKAFYPQTKAQAEREVLAANSDSLKTLALRPHLIFGPGDQNLVPTVLERADAGKLLQIGDGKNLVDFCYIDDCVSAHLLAWKALMNNTEAAGRAYFISQGEPWPLWSWINTLLQLTQRPAIKKSIPFGVAYAVAALLEIAHNLLLKNKEPLLTRFLVSEMATQHYFNISAAKRLLGFSPSCSMEEALKRTAEDFKKDS